MVKINSGAFWMIFAAFSFSIMGVVVKLGTENATIAQAVLFRASAGLPLILFWIWKKHLPLFGRSEQKLLVVRGIFGFISIALYFFAIHQIPLGNAVVLNSTAPVFIALISQFFGKEKAPRIVWVLLPIFFAGVYLVSKPESQANMRGSLAALVSGFTAAIAYLSIRKVTAVESTLTVVFYLIGVSTLVSLPWATTTWQPLTATTLMFLLLAGIFATAGQLAMTRAYKLENASYVSLFQYVTPLFSYILGAMVFKEIPSGQIILGGILILGSVIALVRYQTL